VKLACLTRKGNTCIDEAGGHGKDSSVGIAEATVSDFRKVKKPWFHGYAKGTINPQGQIVRADVDTKYEFKPNHTVDQYSAVCRTLVPECAEDVVDLSAYPTMWNKEIAAHIMAVLAADKQISERRRALVGLSELFDSLVLDANSEEVLIAQSSSLAAVPNFKTDKAELIRLKIEQLATNAGYALSDAVDVLIFNLFYKTKTSSARNAMVKRWFFIVFGDIVLANVERNLSANADGADYNDISAEEEEDDE
jgi:hypothetical protein